jgi:hypothetical protein
MVDDKHVTLFFSSSYLIHTHAQNADECVRATAQLNHCLLLEKVPIMTELIVIL